MTQRGNDGRDWNAKPLVMAGVMITGRDGQTHSHVIPGLTRNGPKSVSRDAREDKSHSMTGRGRQAQPPFMTGLMQ